MPANREARPAVQALSEAARRFGTPVYVIGMAEVAAAAACLETTFDRPWLRLSSLKANDLPTLNSFLHRRGWGALPPLDRSDLVAIEQAGAYGASFTSCNNGRPAPAEALLWFDGSLQPCERPSITPIAPTPTRAPHSAARPARPEASRTAGSATVTKESLP
jgi:hypothetical protein